MLSGCASAPAGPPAEDSEELQAILEYLLEFELEDEGWVDPSELESDAVFPAAGSIPNDETDEQKRK